MCVLFVLFVARLHAATDGNTEDTVVEVVVEWLVVSLDSLVRLKWHLIHLRCVRGRPFN